jgi:hypothetical protein
LPWLHATHCGRPRLFQAFDELLLLKRGETIFQGPLGHESCNVVSYFQAFR